jgi:ketosteroid isomerase-like protein
VRVMERVRAGDRDITRSMKIRTALTVLIFSAPLVSSRALHAAEIDRAADAVAIRTLDEQWPAAAARRDVAATVAFYADDAVLLPANAPIARDAKSIRESWAGLLVPGAKVSWKVTKAEVAKSGELGYLYGTYELSMKDPKGGAAILDAGKIVEIWRKQADGTWKCIVDTYNSDLPVPAAAAAGK